MKVTEDIFGREDYRYISCFNKYKLLKSGGNLEPEVFSILSKDITCDANIEEINLVENKIRHSPQLIVDDSSHCINFGNKKFHALVFFKEIEKDLVDFRVRNDYEPFPGLITTSKNTRVAIRLEKSANCVINTCSIGDCYAIALDGGSSVVLANHKQYINTKELGHIEYSIDLAIIVGISDDNPSFSITGALDELISYYINTKK